MPDPPDCHVQYKVTGIVGEEREVNTIHLSFCKAFNSVSNNVLVSELWLFTAWMGAQSDGQRLVGCVGSGDLGQFIAMHGGRMRDSALKTRDVQAGCEDVLVLAGIELIFFLVAGTVLCFGFSVRMMLITH